MARAKIRSVRFEMLFTPEEEGKIDACVSLMKGKSKKVCRAEFIRRLIENAYADTVKCGMIVEAQHEPIHSAA